MLLAACSQDEALTGDTLPEGKYPLEIASVTMSAEVSSQPWTRVAESDDGNSSKWEWNDTEEIGVQLYPDGETATYTLNAEGTASYDKTPLYWKNTQQATATAWYPVETEVSLADQGDKLAYVLTGSGTGDYQSGVNLTFSHALAKVRVNLTGDGAEEVEEVKIQSYTTCTNTQGLVSTDGAQKGWITMMPVTYKDGTKCWEANVVPEQPIEKIQVDGSEATLTSSIDPVAAALNTINLQVDLMTPVAVPDDGIIDTRGSYIVTGTLDKPITINCDEKVRLTLNGVTYNMSETPIVIEKGNPTIDVKGQNTFKTSSSSTILLTGQDANLTLKGEENSTLNIECQYGDLGNSNAIIGGAGNTAVGDITIKNMALNVNIATYCMGAVIGSGEANGTDASCGDIIIENTDLTVTGRNNFFLGAFIGTGQAYMNADTKCGNIHITLKSDQTKDEFESKLTGALELGAEKVGKGAARDGGTSTCGTITWKNSDGSPAE